MPKLQKKRSSTPCLGICTTTFGDEVCKGCKRFAHEIISWPKYSENEREIINGRLEQFKIKILQNADDIFINSLIKNNFGEEKPLSNKWQVCRITLPRSRNGSWMACSTSCATPPTM